MFSELNEKHWSVWRNGVELFTSDTIATGRGLRARNLYFTLPPNMSTFEVTRSWNRFGVNNPTWTNLTQLMDELDLCTWYIFAPIYAGSL